jgi:hypothetical protein
MPMYCSIALANAEVDAHAITHYLQPAESSQKNSMLMQNDREKF